MSSKVKAKINVLPLKSKYLELYNPFERVKCIKSNKNNKALDTQSKYVHAVTGNKIPNLLKHNVLCTA